MNSKTSLRIAVVAAFLTVFGTGCASIIREPPKPSPVQGNIVLPKARKCVSGTTSARRVGHASGGRLFVALCRALAKARSPIRQAHFEADAPAGTRRIHVKDAGGTAAFDKVRRLADTT